MYRRAARSETPKRSASSPPVTPGRVWRISKARNARAVGLSPVGSPTRLGTPGVIRKPIVRIGP